MQEKLATLAAIVIAASMGSFMALSAGGPSIW